MAVSLRDQRGQVPADGCLGKCICDKLQLMLNTFVTINLLSIFCTQPVRGMSSWVCLRKRFNMITTTTIAAT